MRVLMVARDPTRAALLRRRLWRHGHIVDTAPSGEIGLERAEGAAYDALIVDALLPDIDGAALIKRLRAAGYATPILMLAARGALGERLQGLDAGADDYLATPFSFDELAARLRAITRRGEKLVQEDHLVVGTLVLDRRTRVVMRGDRALTLAPKEFALLEYLMRHPGRVITRAMLLEHVWDYGFDPRANVVDAAIKRLRKAVDAGEARPMVHTVRGVGYKIQA